jgi:hypothetical protein
MENAIGEPFESVCVHDRYSKSLLLDEYAVKTCASAPNQHSYDSGTSLEVAGSGSGAAESMVAVTPEGVARSERRCSFCCCRTFLASSFCRLA